MKTIADCSFLPCSSFCQNVLNQHIYSVDAQRRCRVSGLSYDEFYVVLQMFELSTDKDVARTPFCPRGYRIMYFKKLLPFFAFCLFFVCFGPSPPPPHPPPSPQKIHHNFRHVFNNKVFFMNKSKERQRSDTYCNGERSFLRHGIFT